MNRVLRLTFLVACALGLFAVGAAAQDIDVTGDWELTSESPRGTQTIALTLAQEGSTVTGSAEMRMGAVEVSEGIIEGDKLTFKLVMSFGERSMEQLFEATVSGDTMEGTITRSGGMGGGGRGGNRPPTPFTGVRKTG